MRDAAKGEICAAQSCEVAIADMHDAAVFFLLPPNFDPSPGFPEAKAQIAAAAAALRAASAAKVVCISTIGAQSTETNLLTQLSLLEKEFGSLPYR